MIFNLVSNKLIILSAFGVILTLLITIYGFPVSDASIASHLIAGFLLAQIGYRLIKTSNVYSVLVFVLLLSIVWELLEIANIPQMFIPKLQSSENIFGRIFDVSINLVGASTLLIFYKRKKI